MRNRLEELISSVDRGEAVNLRRAMALLALQFATQDQQFAEEMKAIMKGDCNEQSGTTESSVSTVQPGPSVEAKAV